MTVIQGIILGIVQGFTEFLPVSSSGHLTLASAVMDLPSDILFTIVVHLGTLLAVCIAFRKDIVMLIKGVLGLGFDGFIIVDDIIKQVACMTPAEHKAAIRETDTRIAVDVHDTEAEIDIAGGGQVVRDDDTAPFGEIHRSKTAGESGAVQAVEYNLP